ncbi:TfoX/Sxy family protein [Streptomyces sp. NPDC006283]|uniref:TfoX/Sxy family protein n=1 Tax=Streptomyces sp. NPDC006283 TaxID=3156741 RepID=UPI0033BD07DA
MTYDEGPAERIRDGLGERPGLPEMRMFGGLAFLLGGNMTVGLVGDELIVRVGPERAEEALARPEARPHGLHGQADARLGDRRWPRARGGQGPRPLDRPGRGFCEQLPPK